MTPVDVLVGLDVGTTSVKAVAFAPAVRSVVAVVGRPTPKVSPRSGWHDFPPEALWSTVLEVLQALVERLQAEYRPIALGIASVGEAGLPLDAHGRPLYPIIAWFDPRGGEYIGQWQADLDARWLYMVTGHHTRSIYTAFKLLWLRDHVPEVMHNMAHWLFVADFIAFRLTGCMATVPTLAARSLLYDVIHHRWHPELLARVGLTVEHMPPVRAAGEVIGLLAQEVAKRTGLPSRLPVTIAGHDHPVGMVVAGVQEPGIIVDSSGTAQAIAAWSARFVGDEGFSAGLTCYPATVGGGYLVQGGMATAGAALEWLARLITAGDVDALLRLAATAPPGARGVGWIPFLRGAGTPYRKSTARALFYHLDLDHGPADMARALVEGLACFLAENVDRIAPFLPQPVREIRAIGGSNRERFVLQVKASVTGYPLRPVDIPEAVGVGAACIAGLSVGWWTDLQDIAQNVPIVPDPVLPEPTWQEVYRDLRKRYAYWVQAALAAPGAPSS